METREAAEKELRELRIEAARQNEELRMQRKSGSGALGACGAAAAASAASLEALRDRIQRLEAALRAEAAAEAAGDSRDSQQHQKQSPLAQNRAQIENLVKRKFFVVPAFEIYGGVAGLYDLGPPGCALKNAIESVWRQHFILEDDMLEVSGPCLTPHVVLKASGHVDRFTDLMVKDVETQECLRADKYLEEVLEQEIGKLEKASDMTFEEREKAIASVELIKRQADAYTAQELERLFERFEVKSPKGNPLSAPFPFNLMFGIKIGPKSEQQQPPKTACASSSSSPGAAREGSGFLRPETAQGIFVNFKRLYEHVGRKLPFAAAQIGVGFRNEISPRNGLLRVREFTMAEIEHFCHPAQKNDCPKFERVAQDMLPLLPREQQLSTGEVLTHISLEKAVASGLIANKTLAYFLARTYAFLVKIGIKPHYIRFRQHLQSEMAHYAADCWDAEVLTSVGWIEVAGHADRAAYDLTRHAESSGVELVAMERLREPTEISFLQPIFNRAALGKTFRQLQSRIISLVEGLSETEKEAAARELKETGVFHLVDPEVPQETGETTAEPAAKSHARYSLTPDLVAFKPGKKVTMERHFIPAVIEPSFGVGRILHCLLEHAFVSRAIPGQEARVYLQFPALVAPIKAAILPLSSDSKLCDTVQQLKTLCLQRHIAVKVDGSSASIGRRYARADEIGIPFALTVDFTSLDDKKVTLRERDSMEQVRLSCLEAVEVLDSLCREASTWTAVTSKFPLCTIKED